MKRRIISVLFLLAVFLPSVSSASILTDTALGFGDFYKDSIEESSLETLHVVDSVKDFYSPIIYNSIDIYTSIGVEVTAVFDGVADVVESIGNTFLLSFALGLENTGNTVGNVAMVYNDTLSKANAEISNLSNVSSSVSGNFFGVLKNIPVSFAETFVFVGQATIDTYTDVIIKAGNGVGSALYEGSVFADDLFEDASEATEKVYSDTEALGNVVIESHDYVVTKTGDSLVELYINSSSKINDVSSVANKKVTDTSREYLASIGSVWTNFIDKLSEPLVPLFMHEAAVAVPGFKNTKAVTKTVDDSTEIISQGNPNAINTNIIQRLSGISRLELNSSLLDMKNEIISIILQNKLSFSESQLEKIYNSIGKTAERTDGGNSGTVTSIDASGGTTGFSFSGGPVTSAGTLTLGGILNIANGGTGTSTSPTYGQLLLGNSSGTYDLVATSSLGITSGGGTVSSVDLSVPTGLSVSGGPITSSGTLAVTLTSGYNIPLTASTTEWNTAYASTTNLTTFWSTPSTRITAGTGLSWSGNTLNSTGVTSIGGLTGSVATSSLGITSSQWTTGGSNISYSAGNVGIGTSTPVVRLSIVGEAGLDAIRLAKATGELAFLVTEQGDLKVGDGTSGQISFGQGGNDNINFSNNNYLHVRVGGSDRFTVKNTGLVGVNNTTPSSVLDVKSIAGYEPFNIASSTSTSLFRVTSAGNVGIGTSTPGYALTVAGDISLTGALRASGNAGTSGMVLQTTGTGTQWVATSSLGIALFDTTGILSIARGGTGTSTAPTFGQVLLGNSSGTYDLVATSSLGITSGGGSVSSVDLSVPTGLSVSGGPITSSGTLAITLTSGYNIPLTASTTEWNTAYASTTNLSAFWSTPSTRITAGTGLSWSGNTLNSTGVTSIGGLTGSVATSSLGIALFDTTGILSIARGGTGTSTAPTFGQVLLGNSSGTYDLVATSSLGITSGGGSSQWTTTGSDIYYNTGNVGIGTSSPWEAFSVDNTGGRKLSIGNSASNFTSSFNNSVTLPSYSNAGGTGDRTSSITVSTDLTYYSTLSSLVDGANSSGVFWWNSQANTGKYLRFDFGSGQSKKITEAKFYQQNSATHGTWKWQGSNDGSSWNDIGTSFTLGGSATQTITNLSGNTSGYRYYQIIGVGDNTSSSPFVYEMEFSIDDFSEGNNIYAIQQVYTDVGVAGGVISLQKFGGKVAIGTASALSTLDVNGSMAIGSYAGVNGAPTNGLIVSGNVGIGTTSPTQALSVVGTINSTSLLGGSTNLTVDANGNIIRDPSDENLKENIVTLEDALTKITQLRGVRYDWKDKNRFGSSSEIGVIAQEVELVVPEVVSSGGLYKSVNIKNLVALLIEGVKELKTKVDSMMAWFGTDGDRFNVKGMVCVDDVCISKDQFKQILLNNGASSGVFISTPAPSLDNNETTISDNTSTTTSESTETTLEATTESTSTTTPELIPVTEQIIETTSEVAPTPGPTPVSEPTDEVPPPEETPTE